ncbi:hypothetical protein FJZ55_08295 [Candidatus Woesearchaeota archaeon]|nr:hypothetical protein [Candidatus Woesearchaeota archaeon]
MNTGIIMKQKLSFDDWEQLYIKIDPQLREDLSKIDGIDVDSEINFILEEEYNTYLQLNGWEND